MSAVFKKIMEYNAPYNEKNFNDLITQLKGNNIIPYIGAGMSILNNNFYPSWNKFLDMGFKDYCDKKDMDLFYGFDAEERADFLYNDMGKLSFADYLRDSFSESKLNISRSELCKSPVSLIPLIFKENLLVTTNYDKVIEEMYFLQNMRFNVSHPGHFEALNRSLRNNILLLYKIHGDIAEAQTSIILTKEQYDEAYKDVNLINALTDIFRGKQLLFLGCSLQEDRPLKLMQSVQEVGMENYAIIPCSDVSMKERRVSLENNLRTKAILYPDGQHECLRVILERIVELVNPIGYNSISIKKSSSKEINRFKYDSEMCVFAGRESEISELTTYCTSDESFSWWCATALGGSGKTRLAWEFEVLVKSKTIIDMPNWNVVWDIPEEMGIMDTLIIIDDAFLKVKDLTDFIKKQCHCTNIYKTRLLLLDRNDNELYKEMKNKSDLDDFISESRYAERPLTLTNLNTKNQIEIVKSYSKNRGYNLSDDKIDNILEAFSKIDFSVQRTLYLLFITDAIIEGNDITFWDRKDSLDYIFEREEKILIKKIQTITKGENQAIEKNFWAIMLFVNFTGKTSILLLKQENILKSYISDFNSRIDVLGYTFEGFIEKIGLLKDENSIARIEPHIIGEYFVIKIMERFAKDDIINILSDIWLNIDLSWQFIENLYSDFEDVLKEKKLSNYFENIEISPNIKEIRITAFWAQKHLKTVSIPAGVEYINLQSFSYCDNLTEINVARDNKNYCSVDGILFTKDMKTLIEYPCGRKHSEYVIPDNVIYVSIYNNKQLKKVVLSESVRKVRITECPKLEDVILNARLEKIQDLAFNGCVSIRKIKIPKNVSEIHQRAFNRCKILNTIEVDTDNKTFYSKEGVLYAKYPQSLLIYPFNKRDSEYLVDIGTIKIGDSSFFKNKYLQKVIIPTGTESIGSLAFGYCDSLQIVDMPSTVYEIGRFVFSGCRNLCNIVLPKSLRIMKDGVFGDCKSIKYISIPGGLSSLDCDSFIGCDSLTTVKLSEGVKYLKRGCFSHCKNLKDITVPNSLIDFSNSAFHEVRMFRFHIKRDNICFSNQVDKLFSRFVDDLFTIKYVLVNDNSLIAVEDEIAATKITRLVIHNPNQGTSINYWYKDKECTRKWNYDVDLMPSENIYLYVKLENI